MKIPLPEEAKVALEQSQQDMAAMRVSLEEVKNLLAEILDTLRSK